MQLTRLQYNLTLRAAFVSLAMLLGTLLAAPALAVDGKEYPGSMCKEGIDGVHIPRPTGDIVFDLDGNARHMGAANSGFRYVICPLVRDAERKSGQLLYAAVSVYKPDSTGLFCNLISTPYFGGAGWFSTQWDYSPAGLRLLQFPPRTSADPWLSGSYNLTCILNPPVNGNKSGIAHYGLVEAE